MSSAHEVILSIDQDDCPHTTLREKLFENSL